MLKLNPLARPGLSQQAKTKSHISTLPTTQAAQRVVLKTVHDQGSIKRCQPLTVSNSYNPTLKLAGMGSSVSMEGDLVLQISLTRKEQ